MLTTDIPAGETDPKPEWIGKFVLHTKERTLNYYTDDGSILLVASPTTVGEDRYDFGVVVAKAILTAVNTGKDVEMLQAEITQIREQNRIDVESLKEQRETDRQIILEREATIEQLKDKITAQPDYTMSVSDPAELQAAHSEIRFLRILITKLMNFKDEEMKRLVDLQMI